MDPVAVRDLCDAARAEIRKAVIAQDTAVELLLTALLAGGHVLLEGVPGTAKTLLARAFAATLDLRFGRIQFTPDLMPGDVIGTNLFDFQANRFTLTKGPIFAEVLLADEINRTPPKTQAALLEAMQERSVTIDGTTHTLGADFMVVATQNPIEHQGTYPLPEAQLDRFLFKHVLDYPEREEELDIVRRHGLRSATPDLSDLGVSRVADAAALSAARDVAARVRLNDDVAGYIVDLVRASRDHADLQFGASPRAAAAIAIAARALALLRGRDYAIPDDVKELAPAILRHRVVTVPGAEIEGIAADDVVADILSRVDAPG